MKPYSTYAACLPGSHQKGYGIIFPDFPGCVSVAETLEEAHIMATDALNLHIKGMQDDDQTLPPPTPLEQLAHQTQFKHALWIEIVIRKEHD